MARVGERPALDYNGSYAAAKEVSHAQLAGSMRPYFVWSLLARRNGLLPWCFVISKGWYVTGHK
jgi:hypothetical protein